MDFLAILDVVSNLLRLGDNNEQKEKSKILIIVFQVLLVVGVISTIVCIKFILLLSIPLLFILIFLLVGIVIGTSIATLLYYARILEQISFKEFFIILSAFIFMVIPAAILFNQSASVETGKTVRCEIAMDEDISDNVNKKLIKYHGLKFEKYFSDSTIITKGDSIKLPLLTGRLNFNFIEL